MHTVLNYENTASLKLEETMSRQPLELQHIAETVAIQASWLVKNRRVEFFHDQSSSHAEKTNNEFRRVLVCSAMAVAQTKSSDVDPVTKTDRQSEKLIRELLLDKTPEAQILGEEQGGHLSLDGLTWIVDPIDGTVNYVYGVPAFSVSIAAAWNGQLVAGVVVDVVHDMVFSAALGKPATVTAAPAEAHDQPAAKLHEYLGGRRQELGRKTTAENLATSLIATGFSYSAEERQAQAKALTTILPQVRDIRRLGSAALDLCMLAAGQVDGYYEHGLSAWDYAAGAIIAARAGATVYMPGLDVSSTRRIPTIGGAAGVHQDLLNLLDKAGVGGELPL